MFGGVWHPKLDEAVTMELAVRIIVCRCDVLVVRSTFGNTPNVKFTQRNPLSNTPVNLRTIVLFPCLLLCIVCIERSSIVFDEAAKETAAQSDIDSTGEPTRPSMLCPTG